MNALQVSHPLAYACTVTGLGPFSAFLLVLLAGCDVAMYSGSDSGARIEQRHFVLIDSKGVLQLCHAFEISFDDKNIDVAQHMGCLTETLSRQFLSAGVSAMSEAFAVDVKSWTVKMLEWPTRSKLEVVAELQSGWSSIIQNPKNGYHKAMVAVDPDLNDKLQYQWRFGSRVTAFTSPIKKNAVYFNVVTDIEIRSRSYYAPPKNFYPVQYPRQESIKDLERCVQNLIFTRYIEYFTSHGIKVEMGRQHAEWRTEHGQNE